MSRMFLGFPGLWDGMDSGIGAIRSGTLRTYLGCPWASRDSGIGWTVGLEPSRQSGTFVMCLGCPWSSWDSGMGWAVGLEPSRVGCLGHVWDVPGLLGTLGWRWTVGL